MLLTHFGVTVSPGDWQFALVNTVPGGTTAPRSSATTRARGPRAPTDGRRPGSAARSTGNRRSLHSRWTTLPTGLPRPCTTQRSTCFRRSTGPTTPRTNAGACCRRDEDRVRHQRRRVGVQRAHESGLDRQRPSQGVCVGTARLVIPGGSFPFWSPAALQSATSSPTPSPNVLSKVALTQGHLAQIAKGMNLSLRCSRALLGRRRKDRDRHPQAAREPRQEAEEAEFAGANRGGKAIRRLGVGPPDDPSPLRALPAPGG
jgi:hypothetical protein